MPLDDTPSADDVITQLAAHLSDVITPETVIVCIGNDLCGDDGAGPALAKVLAGTVPWPVIDTGSAPENFIVRIARHSPEVVILVDAMDLGAEPGTVVLNETDKITGAGPSTHGPSPVAFVEALQMMHPCRCAVLGIQPEQTELDAGLSEPVKTALNNAAEAFRIVADQHRGT